MRETCWLPELSVKGYGWYSVCFRNGIAEKPEPIGRMERYGAYAPPGELIA
jgi:hypothetical protein